MSLVRLLGFRTLTCGCVIGRYRELATSREVSYVEEKGGACEAHGASPQPHDSRTGSRPDARHARFLRNSQLPTPTPKVGPENSWELGIGSWELARIAAVPRFPQPHTTLTSGRATFRFYLGDSLDVLGRLAPGAISTPSSRRRPYNLGIRYRTYDDTLPRGPLPGVDRRMGRPGGARRWRRTGRCS